MLAARAGYKAMSLARVETSIRPLLASSFPSTTSPSSPAHHMPNYEVPHMHPHRLGAGWMKRHFFCSSSFLNASRPTLYTMGEVCLVSASITLSLHSAS